MLCFIILDPENGIYYNSTQNVTDILSAKFFSSQSEAETECNKLNELSEDNDIADSRSGVRPQFLRFSVKKMCLLGS